MTIASDQLEPLLAICDEASVLTEGPHSFVFLKNLRFLCKGNAVVTNALLCPQEHSGYATRLFLEQKHDIHSLSDGKPPNWQVHPILGKSWHTWSWQGVSADQTLFEILAEHLNAFA